MLSESADRGIQTVCWFRLKLVWKCTVETSAHQSTPMLLPKDPKFSMTVAEQSLYFLLLALTLAPSFNPAVSSRTTGLGLGSRTEANSPIMRVKWDEKDTRRLDKTWKAKVTTFSKDKHKKQWILTLDDWIVKKTAGADITGCYTVTAHIWRVSNQVSILSKTGWLPFWLQLIKRSWPLIT